MKSEASYTTIYVVSRLTHFIDRKYTFHACSLCSTTTFHRSHMLNLLGFLEYEKGDLGLIIWVNNNCLVIFGRCELESYILTFMFLNTCASDVVQGLLIRNPIRQGRTYPWAVGSIGSFQLFFPFIIRLFLFVRKLCYGSLTTLWLGPTKVRKWNEN